MELGPRQNVQRPLHRSKRPEATPLWSVVIFASGYDPWGSCACSPKAKENRQVGFLNMGGKAQRHFDVSMKLWPSTMRQLAAAEMDTFAQGGVGTLHSEGRPLFANLLLLEEFIHKLG